jgi:hypothetical protein
MFLLTLWMKEDYDFGGGGLSATHVSQCFFAHFGLLAADPCTP